MSPTQRSRPPRGTQSGADVVAEIKARAARGHPLNSGANRGDWLFAAALRFFGAWAGALEAAGFDAEQHRLRNFERREVLRRIRLAAEAGQSLAQAASVSILVRSAQKHFRTWARAVKAAGFEVPLPARLWTQEKVVARIQQDVRDGLRVNAAAVCSERGGLYHAGRKLFGTWRGALRASGIDPGPKLPGGRSRARKQAAPRHR